MRTPPPVDSYDGVSAVLPAARSSLRAQDVASSMHVTRSCRDGCSASGRQRAAGRPGVRYDGDEPSRWEADLGGRRLLNAEQEVEAPDPSWQVAQFRAYAAYTRTRPFTEALERLLAQARTSRTAVLCSESLWWRCHRRIVADVATLGRGVPVLHLMHAGTVTAPGERQRAAASRRRRGLARRRVSAVGPGRCSIGRVARPSLADSSSGPPAGSRRCSPWAARKGWFACSLMTIAGPVPCCHADGYGARSGHRRRRPPGG